MLHHPDRAYLRPGDIVMLRFPFSECQQPTKARPCLVVASTHDDQRLTLAYGTTSPTGANTGYDLRVSDLAEVASAGLHRPTRFVLARRITVAPDDARFQINRRGQAAIGALPERLLLELRRLVQRIGPALAIDAPEGGGRIALRRSRPGAR